MSTTRTLLRYVALTASSFDMPSDVTRTLVSPTWRTTICTSRPSLGVTVAIAGSSDVHVGVIAIDDPAASRASTFASIVQEWPAPTHVKTGGGTPTGNPPRGSGA